MFSSRYGMKRLAVSLVMAAMVAPMQTAVAQRSVADDTLKGAAKGAIIGGIAGDAGKGAAAGAAGSLLFGEIRRNR